MREPYNITTIIFRNKFDGHSKDFTRDCTMCPLCIITRLNSGCYWGIAWKKLEGTEPKELGHCVIKGRPSPRQAELDRFSR